MSEIDSLQIEITTKAKQVDDTIDVLVKKLDLLSGSLKNINKINTSGLKKVANNFNNINKTTSSMSSGLSRISTSAQKTTKSFGGLASSIGRFYATWFFVIRGIKSLGRSIESTADYIETFNYFNVALGKIGSDWSNQFKKYGYENAEAYAKSFSQRLQQDLSGLSGLAISTDASGNGLLSSTGMKNLGLNIQEITQFASQLASVTNSVGQTGEVSLATANAFTKLSADISSLFNLDYSSVMKNLQSGLIGQSRALYKYGIDITNATLQTYAYEFGLSKAVSEMTQAEKMQLRMIAILDQSKVSWGDLANTINSPSNMLRQFTNNLKEVGMVLGQLFIPLMQKVMPVINGITIAIKNLLTSIAGFFGVKLDLSSFGQGFSGIEDDVDGTTDSLDKATESAKKLKKATTTLGIDELNINAPQEDSGGTSSGGGVGGGIDLTQQILDATAKYEEEWQKAFDRMENQAEVFAKKVEKALEPVKSLFKNIAIGDWFAVGQDVTNIVVGITDFFTKAIANVDWEQIGENIGLFIKGIDFTKILSSVGQLIWEAINASIEQWKGMFDVAPIETTIITGILLIPFISNIANAFTTVLIPAFSNAVVFGSNVVGVFELMRNDGMKLHKALTTIFGTFSINFAGIVSILAGAGLAVTSFVSMFTDGFSWIKEALMIVGIALTAVGAIILGAPAMITGVIAGIVAVLATLVIVIKDNWDAIVEWTSNLFDKVSEFFEDLWNGIKEIWKSVSDWFKNNVITPIINFFSPIVNTVVNFFSKLWENIKSVWNTVAKWFNENVIAPIVSFFVGFSTRVGQVFEGLWIIVQAIWKIASTWFNDNVIQPVGNFFLGLATKVQDIFNSLWNGVQGVWISVSGWFNDNVVVPTVGFFLNLINSVSSFFVDLWDGIKSVWTSVSDWFTENIITPLSDAFETVCDNISDFFTGLWNGIKGSVVGAMNAVIGGIESGINYIVAGINKIISGFNDIVSWAAKVAEVDWGGVDLVPKVNLSRIPQYQTGGFPEDGFFFANHNELVGEFSNGRTAVANNEQIVAGIERGVERAVANVLAPYLADIAQNTRETADKEFATYIGDREIARANARGRRSMGYTLITEG